MRRDATPKRFNARLGGWKRWVLEYAQEQELAPAQAGRALAMIGMGCGPDEVHAENEAMEVRRELARELVAANHPEVEFGRRPLHVRPPELCSDYDQLSCRFTPRTARKLLEWGRTQDLSPSAAFRQAIIAGVTSRDAYRHRTF